MITGGAVCQALHTALLGPDAGVLWHHILYTAEAPGALTRLTIRQAHHARLAYIYGGSWHVPTLTAATAALTGLQGTLHLSHMSDEGESGIIGCALSGRPLTRLVYSGKQPCALPPTLKEVDIFVQCGIGKPPGTALTRQQRQHISQQVFDSLAPLSLLQELSWAAPAWQLSSADVAHLCQWHPGLKQLKLTLTTSQRHELDALSTLPDSLNISLVLQSGNTGLTASLLQLRGVPLAALTLEPGLFTRRDKELLSHCSIATLIVRFSDPERRLSLVPAGCQVVYEYLED